MSRDAVEAGIVRVMLERVIRKPGDDRPVLPYVALQEMVDLLRAEWPACDSTGARNRGRLDPGVIRRAYAAGATVADLADLFGVDRADIWPHVGEGRTAARKG